LNVLGSGLWFCTGPDWKMITQLRLSLLETIDRLRVGYAHFFRNVVFFFDV
jgi:hypothetical protein